MFGKTKNFHFIGIGGIGMSGIAEILQNMGYRISGSDLHESETIDHLREMGAAIAIGHSATNVSDQDVVITSSAIPKSNPEIIEANNRDIPIIHRSEMLAELVRMKRGIGVAGTHGKTTTSSIIAHILTELEINPTSVIGGQVFNLGSNAKVGKGDFLVFEADESDGTFLNFFPYLAVVTNIDADHMEHYRSFANLKDAFVTFSNQVPFYGKAILCIDDPTVKEIMPQLKKPLMTYGFSQDADVRAEIVDLHGDYSRFRVYFKDQNLGESNIPLLGEHNVLNALAALAIAIELDLDVARALKALNEFRGVGRRMEHIAEVRGIDIYDDYGHHPSEIKATLKALSQKGRRIVTIFQPHRYSRTQLLYEDFGKAFGDTQLLYLMDIYPAGEEPIEGVDSQMIMDTVLGHGSPQMVYYLSKREEMIAHILENITAGDIILTLGAGDVTKFSRQIAASLIQL